MMRMFWGKLCFLVCSLGIILTINGRQFPQNQTSISNEVITEIRLAVNEWLQQGDPMIQKSWLVGDSKQQLNLAYISQSKNAPDIIIFGNSHVEYIGSKVLKTNSINHFIPAGGNLDSIEEMLLHYKQKNLLPQKVLFGVDIFINDDQFRYQERMSFIENMTLAQHIIKRKIVNEATLFQTGFRIAFNRYIELNYVFSKTDPNINDDEVHISAFLNHDGSLVPCELRTGCNAMPSGAVQQMMFETHRWFESTPNPKSIQQFERIIKQLQSEHIQVAFILTPVHPIAYEGIANNPVMKWIYQYYTSLARQNNIPFLGSYNPADCQLTIDDFEDDDHPKSSTIMKLFAQPYCKFGPWEQFIKNNGL